MCVVIQNALREQEKFGMEPLKDLKRAKGKWYDES
jgi:hypothetical protein